MDKRIGILHLSDVHASEKSQDTIQRLVTLLKDDVSILKDKYNVDIKMVCISGDLINSGDAASVELEIALDVFLQPIMEMLQLDEKGVFIVPGNHEIKRESIVSYIEAGLESTLTSEANIEAFMNKIDTESLKRIEYFDHDFASMFGGELLWESPLARAYMLSIGDFNFGVCCVNSAWRSTGIGSAEKRKMVVGRKQIIDSFEKVKSADIKICIMHHPLDWLVDDDKTAVEKCINQFDIVLNGHIHESDTKVYTSFNGQTLYNTCGKFDNSSDIYNGYTLMAINPYNKDCDVFLRQYMDYPRNCFDTAINMIQGGIFSTSLGNKDDKLALGYNVIHAIESKFLDYANSYFVSNVAAGKALKSFDASFIAPELSRHSEYEKETLFEKDNEEDEISLESICNGHQNILLLGRKEIGKTTVLHYITKHCLSNFNTLKTVPIIINTLYADYAGKNVMTRAAHRFINDYCGESESFSLSDVEALLTAGLCTVMFDNFETVDERQLVKINSFLCEYPNNKFIFSERESVSARCLRKIDVIPSCEYEVVHICSLTKNQIRLAAAQSFLIEDSSALVDKIMLCFKKTTLPKTPFVLSLIISICDTVDFTPINEAVVMEQFMETLLAKSSPTEAYSTTFDFRIKEDFLIHIVSYMHEHNKFCLSNEEFDEILSAYHAAIGFAVRDTRFDVLFIENGVLICTERMVTFRYSCMIEYYLAKKAEQSPDFLAYILSDNNYLNHPSELLYYTGLNRRSIEVVEALQAKLFQDLEALQEITSELEDYNININIALPDESFSQKLSKSKLSQVESDKLHNTRDSSEDKLPEEMDKHTDYEDMEAFVQTLLIYGSCLKNLELITKDKKEHIYRNYILGLCIMLGILKRNTEAYFKEEINAMLNDPEKHSEEDIRRIEVLTNDIIKIALPLAIQNIALENIGTTKLKAIIEGVLRDGESGDFPKLFSVFLFCDLRLPGLRNELQRYVADAKDKSLLTIIFFKLMYYYRYRYFSPSLDSFLENTLADINRKLNGGSKQGKELIIQSLKKHNRLPRM